MSFSPLLWKSFDISDKKHQQLFLGQLTDMLNFLNSAQGLSTLLNGNSLLGASSLDLSATSLGNITSNQTISVAQAASIAGSAGVATAFSPTITFTNMLAGTPFSFRFGNGSGSTVTFRLVATDTSGNAYTIFAFPSGSAAVNMLTGISVPAGVNAMFSGASYGTNLDLLVNLT